MRAVLFVLVLGLLFAGCITPPPPANNTTVVPPGYEVKDYCRADSDCVRLNKCCDCGLGDYVNMYSQENPVCEGPQCKCAVAQSVGQCQGNRCVAVAYQPPGSTTVQFSSQDGDCGNEIAPRRANVADGIALNGSIGAPTPCYLAQSSWAMENGSLVLRITTKSRGGMCIECIGAIPWQAEISGYYDRVEVYYDGRKVFPDVAGFCGWGTNGRCGSDTDCEATGCSGQVCQSTYDEGIATTCEWLDCYDDKPYGVECGCVAGKCQWN